MSDELIIYDLDVLRPKPEYIKLGGRNIDISFIPSGVALEIMTMQEKLRKLTDTPEKMSKIKGGGREAFDSFEISADLCAKITSCQYQEMTKEWLLKNTSVRQLRKLMDFVADAVYKSLRGMEEEDSKNAQKAEPENP